MVLLCHLQHQRAAVLVDMVDVGAEFQQTGSDPAKFWLAAYDPDVFMEKFSETLSALRIVSE
jgi:hypothetical protein